MKCMIPEISWHNREPVLCADIQPIENECYKLATGGADSHLLIWQASILNSGAVAVEMISDLKKHQRAVNTVRWSPNGQYLASADDDANIIIWNLKTDNVPLLEGETNDKEIWIVTKILRGHKEDIYDLCWSPNGMKLLTGSIDNTAIIWDFITGKIESILSDHKAFVQGVAWDPKGQFIATLSSDRLCRVFESSTWQIRARIGKGLLPVPKDHTLHNKEVKYFHDDTFKSYFRRVQFSPDGNLLITPCGNVETDDCKKPLKATFLFTLDSLSQPSAILPLSKQCSIAVRCCPTLFKLRSDGPDPIVDLPYRMIIAIATYGDVILYDTQQLSPFAHFQNIHYTGLTDLTWSIDGRLLMACSTDGFCTFITFDTNELGQEYVKDESEHEETTLNMSGFEELHVEEADRKENVIEDKSKKSNFLMKWANQAQQKVTTDDEHVNKRLKLDELSTNGKTKKDLTLEIIDLSSPVKIAEKLDVKVNKITPKRIIPTTIVEKQIATPIAVRRKPRTSEVKPNSLLKFLKSNNKSPGKLKSNCSDTSQIPTDSGPIIVTVLDELEARDAWRIEEDVRIVDKTKQDAVIQIDETDDLTGTIPDFKLQLEESTLGSHEQKSIGTSNNMNVKVNDMKIKDESKTSENPMISILQLCAEINGADECHANQEIDRKIVAVTTDASVKTLEKENSASPLDVNSKPERESDMELKNDNTDVKVLKKTGRRIPLITLSSPKTKKRLDT